MEEVRAGDLLLTFDGRVVEIFGWLTDYSAKGDFMSTRFHVANLELGIEDEPDRKGRYDVTFKIPGRPFVAYVHVPGEDWPGVQPFIERVRAAIPA